MKVSQISWTTGPSSINRTDVYAAVGGTDLGIMWDDKNGGVLHIFGDTFSDNVAGIGKAKGLDWRNNVLCRSTNEDYQTHGVVINWWNTDKPNHAQQIINKDTFGTEYTMIPTSGIAVEHRQYVSYMAVDHWGPAGVWYTQYAGIAWSDDYGKTWTKDSGARWGNYSDWSQNFQMLAFARPYDGYMYMYGTPNGRFGGAKLMRCPEWEILDLTTYRYWDGTTWNLYQQYAINMIPSPVSELSIAYHTPSKQWLAAYYHPNLNAIVVLTAPAVTGPWSPPTVVASAADYPGLYGFYFHPWSMGDTNPCASMSQWPPYETELMQLSEIPGTPGLPVNVSKLTSAQGYVNNIDAVSTPAWCGTNNIFPVQAEDGRKLWISGMSYAGYLTGSRARPLNYQTIMNTVLEEKDLNFTPYATAFNDSVGRKHLFDSRQIPGIATTTTSPVRLDPITAISINQSLYMTVSWSGSNYSYPYLYDQGANINGSSIFLVEIPLSTLTSGSAPIRKSVLMPSVPLRGAGNINFGSGLYVFDNVYAYILGRAFVQKPYFHHYLARVPLEYLQDVNYVPSNMEYFSYLSNTPSWNSNIGTATPILTYMGPNIDIRKDVDGFYHYLINIGGRIYLVKQEEIARDHSQLSPLALSLMAIPVDAGSTSFSSPCSYDVGWANLTSGNRLGMYTVVQTNQSYDQSHPFFARPHFFEYNDLTGVAAASVYTQPP